MARQFASRLSLIAFAASAVHGAIAGSEFQGAMKTALAAAAVFYATGLLFGDLARRLVEESVRAEVERPKAGVPQQRQGSPKAV